MGMGFFLFRFHLEVSEYGIEDSVNREVVVTIKVVAYGRLSMYVKALYCVELDAFLLHAIFPRETFYIN